MMEWDEGTESISQLAHRLRAAAVALPERVSEERIIDLFTQSLSGRLRDHALAVRGRFDEVASRVSMMHHEPRVESPTGVGAYHRKQQES